MNISLKRRLISAIIVLALIVIFVPMLFTQHNNYTPSNVVMATPAIETPAAPPQQPEVASPVAQNDNSVEDQVKVAPAVSESASNNDDANKTEMAANDDQGVADQTSLPAAKPEVTQTDVTVSKIQPVQHDNPVTLADNSPSQAVTAIEKTPAITKHAKTVYLSQVLKKHSPVKARLAKKQPPTHVATVTSHKLPAKPVAKPETNLSKGDFYITHSPDGTLTISTEPSEKAKTSPAKTAVKSKPMTKVQPRHNGYVVQLGAFSHSGNANALIHRLRQHGFTTFGYKEKRPGNKILTHVYVGPQVTRSHAKEMVQQLQKVVRIKGTVVLFSEGEGRQRG